MEDKYHEAANEALVIQDDLKKNTEAKKTLKLADHLHKWVVPLGGWVKLNMDGS